MEKSVFLDRLKALLDEFEDEATSKASVALDVKFCNENEKFAWNGGGLIEVQEDFALETC